VNSSVEIIFYNEEKSLIVKHQLMNGKLDGISTVTTMNNEPVQKLNYKDGKLQGELIQYMNGKERTKLIFNNNLQHGTAIYYDEKGNVTGTENYVNGLKEGLCEWKSPEGKLLFTENYLNGKLHGEKLEYHDNGKVKKRYIFNNGEMIGVPNEYWKNGWKKTKLRK
jgi:uncharacterized protein